MIVTIYLILYILKNYFINNWN